MEKYLKAIMEKMQMKEITFLVPEDSTKLVTELVERLGGSVDKRNMQKPIANRKRKISSTNNKKKGDPLALFGKYPDFPLDPKTYRKELWQRNQKL